MVNSLERLLGFKIRIEGIGIEPRSLQGKTGNYSRVNDIPAAHTQCALPLYLTALEDRAGDSNPAQVSTHARIWSV